jgi:predicted metal-dependent phosphoesterase TrpH
VLKVELHSHTSDDPSDWIPHSTRELIDRAADLGYDAIAITLHGRRLDPEPEEAYARRRGLVLIPGIEQTIEGCHVLLLNFSSASEAARTFGDLAALRAREPNGLVVAPHPFFPFAHGLASRLDAHPAMFDAIEYNAMYAPGLNFNVAAERWAAGHGKPMVGNGDVHRLRQLGTTYSLVDSAPDPASICAAIKAGDVRVVTAPLSWPFAISTFTSMVVASVLWGGSSPGPSPATV